MRQDNPGYLEMDILTNYIICLSIRNGLQNGLIPQVKKYLRERHMLSMQMYVVHVNDILLWLNTRNLISFVIPCDIKIHYAWVFITTCLGGDSSPWHTLACLYSGVNFFTTNRGISVSMGASSWLVLRSWNQALQQIRSSPPPPPLLIMQLTLSKAADPRSLFRLSQPRDSGLRTSTAHFLSRNYTLQYLHIGLRQSRISSQCYGCR